MNTHSLTMPDIEDIKKTLRRKSIQPTQTTRSLAAPNAFNIPDESLSPLERSTRQAWKGIIVDRKDAKYLFTIRFKVHCTNAQAITSLNFYLRAIARNLSRRGDLENPINGFTGLSIIEPHMLLLGFHGQLHFHLLIDEIPGVTAKEFREAALAEMVRVKTSTGWPMLHEKVVDVREIWEIEGLADYLTKTQRMHTWKTMDNICFVEPKGLTGIGISYQWNARNY